MDFCFEFSFFVRHQVNLDVRIWSSAHVQCWQFGTLHSRHIQSLCVKIIFQLKRNNRRVYVCSSLQSFKKLFSTFLATSIVHTAENLFTILINMDNVNKLKWIIGTHGPSIRDRVHRNKNFVEMNPV